MTAFPRKPEWWLTSGLYLCPLCAISPQQTSCSVQLGNLKCSEHRKVAPLFSFLILCFDGAQQSLRTYHWGWLNRNHVSVSVWIGEYVWGYGVCRKLSVVVNEYLWCLVYGICGCVDLSMGVYVWVCNVWDIYKEICVYVLFMSIWISKGYVRWLLYMSMWIKECMCICGMVWFVTVYGYITMCGFRGEMNFHLLR